MAELKGPTGFINIDVIECWQWIIENVNYWPIFKIASDVLSKIPTDQANEVLDLLYRTASKLAGMGATSLNDLSGRMFQKLIADRKFLATFLHAAGVRHLARRACRLPTPNGLAKRGCGEGLESR